MTTAQLKYFNDMKPGEVLQVSKIKNPANLIQSAKEYIDQTGLLVFDQECTQVTKLHPFPTNDEIGFYIE